MEEVLNSLKYSIKVLKVVEKNVKRSRPGGLNTVDMLKHASSKLHIGPHHAMKVAERLYLSGFITYPRTESTAYPKNFAHKEIISKIKSGYSMSMEVAEFAGNLLAKGINKPKKGVDVGDHPPITPSTKVASHLSGDEARLYNFVTRRYLASLAYDAVLTKTSVTFAFGSTGDYKLTVDGSFVKDKGYLNAADWECPAINIVKKFVKGNKCVIKDTAIVEGNFYV